MKTMHRIILLGMSVSNNSFAINHEMVQERWIMHPYVDKNTFELTPQRGVSISCPHPSLMKCMRINDMMLW